MASPARQLAGLAGRAHNARQEGDTVMDFGRLGVWCSTDRLDAAGLRALLRSVEEKGYGTLWYPESRGYESIALGSFLLANSTRPVIGSSIANIYARDAFTARRALASLNGLHGGR